ncbi:MAG: tetratricopeptide repeat protein [Myxococcales bacterium]|nr:tetratricopeptide repeat protein [Myxococcales bacterium]
MHRLITTLVIALSVAAGAQTDKTEKKTAKDTELKKKETNLAPEKGLAGDITRKKEKREEAPAMKYDQFRTGIELQVASKRREQIGDLQKIIELSQDKKEKPGLHFRLGELYWEESKYFFFEANRKDDDKIRAMNADDKAAVERAESEKSELLSQSKEYAQKAITEYSTIVQNYKDFERTDEVLYFLGLNLMEMNDEKRGLVAYNRLITKYQKSRYLPDAYLAVGEYYFNNSKSKREMLEKALDNYKNASKFTDNAVYGYAMYKQGWCYFNMNDFDKAMDQFKAVVLYAKLAGAEEVEGPKKGGKSNRSGLAKEARNDYVRAFSRTGGGPSDGKDRFSKLADTPDDLRTMMKQLAGLFYEDGKDKEAALAYDMLIKERPLSPEAPGFQSRIVDCVMRAGNKQMTVQQVRRLVKIMDDVLKGNPKLEDKDKKSLDEARELSERTISNLAVNWHNEAKKTRDDSTFEFANAVYADYLTLFPQNPKAYALRFFWAELLNDNLNKYDRSSEEYTKVFNQDIELIKKGGDAKPGKYMVNAAYNSILAWDEVVKGAITRGEIKQPAITDPNAKLDIHPLKRGLLDACERYLKYIEKGEKLVEIQYKAAKIYYDYNHLDEAVGRFADIALKHPEYKFEDGSKAGEVAANLVLDSYNLLGDWAKVNEWARKFYAEEKLAQGDFRVAVAKLIEQSSFKLINQLEAKKEYAKAGEQYMQFVAEWPKSEFADKALFNAAIDFYNAKMLDRAIEVRKKLITSHPKSQYVPQTMFALAEGYEAIADFEPASDYYEAYAANYEKSKTGGGKKAAPKKGKKGKGDDKADGPEQVWEEQKAQDALFNAGVFREGLGQYKVALKNRERYLELWPKSKDAEAVEKSILDLYEKMGAWKKVLDGLEAYEKKNTKDPNKILTSEGRIATIYEEKLKNQKAARGVYERIWKYYEQLSKKQRDNLEIQALDPVARASFLQNEDDWKKYAGIKLRWSKVQNIGELKGSIKVKGEALGDVQKAYTRTVALKSADPAICALHKIGMAYDQFAEQLINFPVPKGLPEELLIELRPQFEQQAEQPKAKATEAFAAVVQKSQELDVFNPCTQAALNMLRTKYAPIQFPPMHEDTFELKTDGRQAPAIGGGVLTSIQAVPTVTAEKAAEMQVKAREVSARDTKATEPELDLTGPEQPAPAPKTAAAPAPTPAPAPKKPDGGPGPKKPTPDDEPEDTL